MGTSDTQVLTTYHVKPSSYIKHWLNTCPELLGGRSCPLGANESALNNACCNFGAFWRNYQVQHPSHMVYTEHQNLETVVPILLHGDEGRAVKRTNYLVLSMESPLGSMLNTALRCSCSDRLAHRSGLPTYGSDLGSLSARDLAICRQQIANLQGHSYLSKWLLFGMGGWLYKKHPHVVDELLAKVAEDLKELFFKGVVLDDGQRFFAAVVAVKGDLDFHKKIFELKRSYANLGRTNEICICHACMAGSPLCNFEDYRERPAWLDTLFVERPRPQNPEPVLVQVPYDHSCPEQILHWDLFHVVRLGVARDIIGGVLIVLLRLGFVDYPGCSKDIRERLDRAHSLFSLFCSVKGKAPGLRSFTKAFFNMKSLISSPWSSSKGSDTTLLLEWLSHFLIVNIATPAAEGHTLLLKEMLQVVDSTLELGAVYRHKLWLERECARRFYVAMMTLLRGYTLLARRSMVLRIRAFVQKPKCHALHHIAHTLKKELEKGSTLIASPAMSACDMNEDFMGRISRLSRRVGFKLCDLRVFHRYFFKISALLNKRRCLKERPLKKRVRKTNALKI